MEDELFPRAYARITPGAVHVPDRLDTDRRRALLAACRDRPGPRRACARSVRPGRHDDRPPALPKPALVPVGLRRTAGGGDPAKQFPAWLGKPDPRALTDAPAPAAVGGLSYDIAPVNSYDADAHMGTPPDADEKPPAPVVPPSPDDTCVLRCGNTESRGSCTRTRNFGPGCTRARDLPTWQCPDA
ncbi:alpha-ketoglutarate-dependent dioxygenase AlkB [Streptomyces fuscichromogenes]|uniref:Alkylated DNA repair protein n=1 Tax=Streptomyces fuscichromogenes TaxID=1324013 RepID=A0A917XCN4_9ACTN|nr:alpha-ketoglutarate-dependent dioxygenase AlkB [Streptomyces fuscichromogenes]GGN09126.1 alkylated DNA repair protein [Streptomyces fuscichromogenes]